MNDKGTAGIRATLDALDGALVGHSGTARTAAEAAAPSIIEVAGVPIAHLAYTWGFNGTPPAEAWMADVLDPDRILTDAREARADGAALVIVSLHWGNEYDTSGSADQRALADRLLASPDVDLIVGHGPHVLQPIERFHGKYALLSVGNLVANQGTERPATYDGVIAEVTFSTTDDGQFRERAGGAPDLVRPRRGSCAPRERRARRPGTGWSAAIAGCECHAHRCCTGALPRFGVTASMWPNRSIDRLRPRGESVRQHGA